MTARSSIMRNTHAVDGRLNEVRRSGLATPAAVVFVAGRTAPALRPNEGAGPTMLLCGHAYYPTEAAVLDVLDRGLAALNRITVPQLLWHLQNARPDVA